MSITFTDREDSGITVTLPTDATEQDIITAILDGWPGLSGDDHRMGRLRNMARLISTSTGDLNTDPETAWEITYHAYVLGLGYWPKGATHKHAWMVGDYIPAHEGKPEH